MRKITLGYSYGWLIKPHSRLLEHQREVAPGTRDAYKFLRADLIQYGRALNHQFCYFFHIKLPREIRDVVYSYVIGRRKVAINWQYFRAVSKDYVSASGYRRNRVRNHGPLEENPPLPDLIFWAKAWTTEPVQKELGATYYRISEFNFYGNINLVERFLQTDTWELDILPCDYVKCLTIAFTWGFLNYGFLGVDHRAFYPGTIIHKGLYALSCLPPGAFMRIEICINNMTCIEHILELLAPHLNMFQIAELRYGVYYRKHLLVSENDTDWEASGKMEEVKELEKTKGSYFLYTTN